MLIVEGRMAVCVYVYVCVCVCMCVCVCLCVCVCVCDREIGRGTSVGITSIHSQSYRMVKSR